MKYLLAMLLLAFTALPSFAQSEKTSKRDSLFAALRVDKEDTNKVKTLLAIAQLYAHNKLDSVMLFSRKADTLSEKLNYPMGKLRYMAMYSSALNEQEHFNEAITLNKQAIELSLKIHNDKALASAYNNIAASYFQLGQYETALDYYLKCAAILEKLDDRKRLVMLYGNLSQVFEKFHQPRKGYAYGLKAIELCKALGDDYNLVNALINTASNLHVMKQYDSALTLLAQARETAVKIEDDKDLLTVLINTNENYEKTGRYQLMQPNADKALAIARQLDKKEGICEALIDKGSICFYNKQYATGKPFADTALSLALENEVPDQVQHAYRLLASLSLGMGNPAQYDAYQQKMDSVAEAVLSAQVLKNTQEMDTKYQSEKKEQQIKLQKTRLANFRLWMVILVVLIASVLLLLYTSRRSHSRRQKILEQDKQLQQQQITQLEKEKQLMAAQAVLKGQDEERTRLAKDLHDGLGGILSGTKYALSNMKDNMVVSGENAERFDRTMNMLNQSIAELRRVAHNMMPEALVKVGLNAALEDLCNSINRSGSLQLTYQSFNLHEDTIPQNTASVIYRMVQELINNLLKHAEAAHGVVQLVRNDNSLSITVEDDGKGFDTSLLQHNTGMGFGSLGNRVTFLRGTLDVQSAPGKGTSVTIEIPDVVN